MVDLVDRKRCSGCMACLSACPRGAIVSLIDHEGFSYPSVVAEKCVQCGRCRQICPSLNMGQSRSPLRVFAMMSADKDLRLASSSGGVFTLLAQMIIKEGGVVFGAAIDSSDGRVYHRMVENLADLPLLRGTKYVQSDVGDTYQQVRRLLENGCRVLYSGTPCQIAALRRVVGLDRPTLLTVEVICHGVPSPLAWKCYLESRKDIVLSTVSFRDKVRGWYPYSLSYDRSNHGRYSATLNEDSFLRGFQVDLFNRLSCHACTVREFRSGADLTIGDYWHVGESMVGMDDNLGTSVVFVHSERGLVAVEAIKVKCRFREGFACDVYAKNPSLVRDVSPHRNRARFFALLGAGVAFDRAVEIALRRPLYRRLASRFRDLLRSVR